MNRTLSVVVGLLLLASSSQGASTGALDTKTYPLKPKLVVVIAIDQFRSDYLTRYKKLFLPAKGAQGEPGGFNFLLSQAAYYPFAQYSVLQCMTGPGHSMILSGSLPYRTGIPLNDWFENGKGRYCVEDSQVVTVGSTPEVASFSKMGYSPKNFSGTTLGDELKTADLPSKVVSISLKDRAAILMGGNRADAAYWFDPKTFQWVSSSYYFPDKKLPAWTTPLNTDVAHRKGQSYSWLSLQGKQSSFKRVIELGDKHSLASPVGGDLLVDFTEAAIKEHGLGRSGPDLLALSFSAHDYVGHAFGPNAEELLEMTLSEDRQLARLFRALNKAVPGGLAQTWIVLTADHGVGPAPSYQKEHKLPGGTIDMTAVAKLSTQALQDSFGAPPQGQEWIPYTSDLNLWINPAILKDKSIPAEKAQALVKKAILEAGGALKDGIFGIATESEIKAGIYPPGDYHARLEKTFREGRSGHLIVLPRPGFMEKGDFAGHMTGYSYDRSVPLLFWGAPFTPGLKVAPADPIDIAPTLAFLLGVIAPSQSEGRVLSESLRVK